MKYKIGDTVKIITKEDNQILKVGKIGKVGEINNGFGNYLLYKVEGLSNWWEEKDLEIVVIK